MLARILLFILFFGGLHAQELYHRVKVDLINKEIQDLAKLGLEVDHGHLALGRFLENDFSESQIKKINAAGFSTKIVIQDVGQFYKNQLAEGLERINNEGCFGDPLFQSYITPANFTLGSMGGFYTYQEMLNILEDMHDKFPNLISVKKQISDIETHEGRPIYSIVISDNPSISENEPKSLYTAIHHAREPNSMTQLIYFMWYLLENYGENELVTEIIDEVELHFIPCINPDGYIYNQTTDPEGGGFWRKNRRDNGDGTFGVDLNRNYGLSWGIDDIGSSPETDSDVYRGPSPFSEPETQAVKWYCEQNDFNFALNYHTFGNLLIYPWGYNDTPTAESPYFTAISEEITKLNNYQYGTASETVGYIVNGVSDDWMYGEEDSKTKIYAMTPEVGVEGFWPPIDAIVNNCQANIQANLSLALLHLNYPIVSSESVEIVDPNTLELEYVTQQIGAQEGEYDVVLELLSDNGVIVIDQFSHDLSLLEEATGNFTVTLDSEIDFGEEIVLVLKTNQDIPFGSDTIRLAYTFGGEITQLVEEPFGDDLFWIPGGEMWFYDLQDFISSPASLSDSPQEYMNSESKSLNSLYLDLPENGPLLLQFDLKVDIEQQYDFAALYIQEVGMDREVLCGKFSSPGSIFQELGLPLYDGNFDWIKEEIDISLWAGKTVRFVWRFQSDGYVQGDGFKVDDWTISTIKEVVKQKEINDNIRVYPNPTTGFFRIDMPFNQIERIHVVDMMGKTLLVRMNTNEIDISDYPKGMYHVMVIDKQGKKCSAKLIKG